MNEQVVPTIGEVFYRFLQDPRTIGVFLLIVIDVATGIWSAWVRKVFALEKLARFLRVHSAQLVVGYLGFYLISLEGLPAFLQTYFDAAGGAIVGQALVTLAGGFSWLALIDSIRKNWRGVTGGVGEVGPWSIPRSRDDDETPVREPFQYRVLLIGLGLFLLWLLLTFGLRGTF